MSGFPTGQFGTGLVVTFAAVMVLLFVTWLVGRAIGRFNVIDISWGAGLAVVALVSLAWSAGSGNDARRILVAALVSVWGLRLAVYIAWRSRGEGEDPRYEQIFARAKRSPAVHALLIVYPGQALILWFVSLPAQVAMYEPAAVGALASVGVAIWLLGFFFESVGDRQMQRFRSDPANRGAVMDRGLWRYTRHPNYFGDACVWWGIYVIAAQQLPGALTVLSPLVMTFTLARGTGKPLLEKGLVRRRPGYAEYVRRTSGFVPWPPRAVTPVATDPSGNR